MRTLPGIMSWDERATLVEQLVESDRRNRYVRYLTEAELSPRRLDPLSGVFDPLKAAVLRARDGAREEAYWMVFLFTHFGKHRVAGWRYAADVYGRLGADGRWDWDSVRDDVTGFRDWLEGNRERIERRLPRGGFGNHRKYESLSGHSALGTGAVVESYVGWVGPGGQQEARFEAAVAGGADRTEAFDELYRSMAPIRRFGRTARFDYLSMVSKLGLAPIRPGRAYLVGATGPLAGARLLFDPPDATPSSAGALDMAVVELEDHLRVGFDALEDALCNWQKSPQVFKPFRV